METTTTPPPPTEALVIGREYIVTHMIPDVQTRPRESRLGFLREDRGALIFTARGPRGRCDAEYGGDQAFEPAWIIGLQPVVRNEEARYVGRPARA
jgi:hypothetical protein